MLELGDFIVWYGKGWKVSSLTDASVTLTLDGTNRTFDFPRQVFIAYEPGRVTQ